MKQFSENYKIYISHYQNNLNLKAVCHAIITAKLYVALGWGPKGEKWVRRKEKSTQYWRHSLIQNLKHSYFLHNISVWGATAWFCFICSCPTFNTTKRAIEWIQRFLLMLQGWCSAAMAWIWIGNLFLRQQGLHSCNPLHQGSRTCIARVFRNSWYLMTNFELHATNLSVPRF